MQIDKINRTPLHWAVTGKHSSCVALLVQKSANIFAETAARENVLHMAIEDENIELLIFLIDQAKTVGDIQKLFTGKNEAGKTPSEVSKGKPSKSRILSVLKKAGDNTVGSSMCILM